MNLWLKVIFFHSIKCIWKCCYKIAAYLPQLQCVNYTSLTLYIIICIQIFSLSNYPLLCSEWRSALVIEWDHSNVWCLCTSQPRVETEWSQGISYQQKSGEHFDELVQERRNSNALAMELRLSCTNPTIWLLVIMEKHQHSKFNSFRPDYCKCICQHWLK